MANLYAGTSGFAYPGWVGRFYEPGTRGHGLLPAYASRLKAVELNNTFYQQPRPERIAAWLAATPPEFRFAVKAQRGASLRALGSAAAETVGWLTAPYTRFGARLGAVLFRVPESMPRDDGRLEALLNAWPPALPLAVEFQHPSWQDDVVFEMLRSRGASLCATDLDGRAQPDLRLTGRFVYLRLRRTSYDRAELTAWADRLSAFVDAGVDCYVFFRHDADGTSALQALRLQAMLQP